jgi:hypothetical protein
MQCDVIYSYNLCLTLCSQICGKMRLVKILDQIKKESYETIFRLQLSIKSCLFSLATAHSSATRA